MRTYTNKETWRVIQKYLPLENQITQNSTPNEEIIKRKTLNLHIDHYIQTCPKGTVIMFHGVGGNGRLLSFIAVPLWKAGYEVICPDLPLYGLTEYHEEVTYRDWIDCGIEISNHYKKTNVPLFLFGLSAGGMLAYQVACKLDKIDGILATCLLDQRIRTVTMNTASSLPMALLGKPMLGVAHHLIGSMKVPMKYVCNMNAIVNNKQLAEIMTHDKLSSGAKVSLEFLHGMLNPEITTEPQNFDKCPILLVHPDNDQWTDIKLSRLFFDSLTVPKKLVMLPKAGHFPIEKEGLVELQKACIDFLNSINKNM